ncbi:MAG: glycosyltransferase family 2 protein [Bacteroidetes bacterium]|nr:glycosyltransferase family 2 protein [Bacteroidota bacterium]
MQLITWLEKNNYTNIVILDNNSTYPKLLDYYRTTKHKVIFLKKNVGYKALWKTDVFEQFKRGFYVYTDPDLVPNENCPPDLVFKLFKLLEKYGSIEKCGPALAIDNLPNNYNNKNDVIKWEKKHWENKVEKDLYDAPIDTTFALYRPFAMGEAEICKGYRLAGEYTFLHLPWYLNSNSLPEEEVYYKNNINKDQSHWVK